MQVHIKIPKMSEFYLTITRQNPIRREIVEVERREAAQELSEDQMERNLDRVNMWIGNCDQKASFLLALIGIVVTIIFTSNAVGRIETVLVKPFLAYLNNGEGVYCVCRTIDALLLVAGLICVFIAVLFLLICLRAKTNYKKFQQPGMEEKSLLYYGSIASQTYSEFSMGRNDHKNDYRSQVYTNSVICDAKFKNYKRALLLTICSLPLLTLAFLFLLFI